MLKGVTSTETGAELPCSSPGLQSLPLELTSKIFSYLQPSDLHALTTVSKGIHAHVITATKFSEMDSIKNFIEALISKLEEKSVKKLNGKTYRWQVHSLKRILGYIRPVRFSKLLDLKKHILALKKQVTDVLKTMDSEETVALREIHCPHFFENIFDEAATNREADRAETEHYNNPRSIGDIYFGLPTISFNLLIYYGFERVLELADSCSDDEDSDFMRTTVVDYLTYAGEIDKAIEVTTLFLSYDSREGALASISDHLASIGEFDRAIHVAASNASGTNPSDEDETISSTDPSHLDEPISVQLAKAGQYDDAFAVVKLISNRQFLYRAVKSICRHLSNVGEFDRARLFANLISEKRKRHYTDPSDAYELISVRLAKAGLHDRAYDVVKLISKRQALSRALESICDHLVRVGEFDRALLFADLLSEEEKRYCTIESISIALATAGHYEEAIDCAAKLPRIFKHWRCGFLSRSATLLDVFKIMMDAWIKEAEIIANCSTFDRSCIDFSEYQIPKSDYLTKKNMALSKEEEELRCDLLYSFSRALAGVGAFNRAIELAALIDGESDNATKRMEVVEYVSNALLVKGVESALSFALSVSDRNARRSVLHGICSNKKCDLQFVINMVEDTLRGTSNALKEDEIIDIGLSLPWEKKIRIIADIFVVLMKAGNLEKAFEAVQLIDYLWEQSEVLELVFEDLCKAGDLSEAVEVAKAQPNNHRERLLNIFVKAGNFERALEVANLILNVAVEVPLMISGMYRQRLSNNLLETFVKTGNLERVPEIAKILPDLSQKTLELKNVLDVFIIAGNPDKALGIALTVHNPFERDRALKNISEACLKAGNLDKALEVVPMISLLYGRDRALKNISDALIKAGNLDKALEVAQVIVTDFERAPALENISEAYIKDGNLEKALEAAEMIPDLYRRDLAQKKISVTSGPV